MVELYELRQFVAFANAGTLSEAAEILHLSQPALSRNMKKLENDLGVTLFVRKKNRLELNENGEYVLELTKKLLEDADSLTVKAREFDRRNRTIVLGVCAPAPVWLLAPLISNLYPHMALQTETDECRRLLTGLENNIYQLIAVNKKPEGKQYCCKECGFVQTKMMPDSRFLTQSNRFDFNELVQASTLASFTSNLAEKYSQVTSGRINVPISDKEATVTYYLVCKSENKREFLPLFSALRQ